MQRGAQDLMQGVSMTSVRPASKNFDAAELRRRFGSAYRPKAWIYWTDLLVSAVIGWAAFVLAVSQPLFSTEYMVGLLVAIFALLRAVLFIHELAHIKPAQLPGFEIAWHAAVGTPLMVPSLMYVGSHNDHHKRNAFGTGDDPEYAPIARYPRFKLVTFVLGVAFVPLVLPLRWAVLAPLSYVIPPLRKLVVERASTLVINPDYRRPMPKGKQARRWMTQELASGAVFWLAVGAWALGWLPTAAVFTWVLLTSGILVINQIRTLAAHRYENDGREVDSLGQLMDSVNLRGVPILTALIAPVGLRYHALHHFLPAVPYHSLGALHRRLCRELPSEAAYHRTEAEGILPMVRRLWDRAPA
jgi:fatty acid desaturase